ncbi:MAG: hypothetical protein HC922_00840 [Leptolyngbyaceae cyanobacterium SM2_3_12]|nr:hypothetical protein [Leptolyngbyaceae cyanobacterium SM2_3_12]
MAIQRPFGVTLIGILMLVVGIARTIMGLFLLFKDPLAESNLQGQIQSNTLPPELAGYFTTWIGIVYLIIGLLGLVMALGMFKLKGWAWLWTVVVASFNLIGAIAGFLTQQRFGIDAVLSIIIFSLVVYYLSTTPVRRAFGFGHPV